MAIAEISVVPLGTESPSVSRYVAECLNVVGESGLSHEVHGMGTIVEGDLEAIFAVIRKMHEVPFNEGVQRVITSVRVDDRRDKPASAEGKVASAKEKA